MLVKTQSIQQLDVVNSEYSALINQIDEIDTILKQHLDEILHHSNFQSLEGSWRGLTSLVQTKNTCQDIKIRFISLSKPQILNYYNLLEREWYDKAIGAPGGEPYSIMLSTESFSCNQEDLLTLNTLAITAKKCLCPFLAAASPNLFKLNRWEEIYQIKNLYHHFEQPEYLHWNSLRKHTNTQFITLTAPRMLSRRPYCFSSYALNYKEATALPQDYCWISSAFGLTQCLIRAFKTTGWTTAIRGQENGGRLERQPLTHTLSSTECFITDRLEKQLSDLGILALCHYQNSDEAVFYGAQTLHKTAVHEDSQAQENAETSSRLPYILASSRFAHYLKIITRDKIGSFSEAKEIELWLNRWISQYVNANPSSSSRMKAQYPLAEAKICVSNKLEQPGKYHAVVWLRPWLQLESLTASIRLTTELTQK